MIKDKCNFSGIPRRNRIKPIRKRGVGKTSPRMSSHHKETCKNKIFLPSFVTFMAAIKVKTGQKKKERE